MAACKNFQHIFENLLPENQTLLGSLPKITPEESSFSELFGELYFKDTTVSSSSLSLSLPYDCCSLPTLDSSKVSAHESWKENRNPSKEFSFSVPFGTDQSSCSKSGFSSIKSESLQLCTEGLGFESLDDIEDLQGEMIHENWKISEEKIVSTSVKHFAAETASCELKRSRKNMGAFPPPLSFMGKSGNLGVCFKSYRKDGRFVLKEVRIPTQEFLQTRREDGRLKLQIIQPDDIPEDEDEGVEDSEKYEEENDVSEVRQR